MSDQPAFSAPAKKMAKKAQEVRFTRNGQGLHFLLVATVLFFLGLAPYREMWQVARRTGEVLITRHPLWLACLPLALLLFYFGGRMIRHAYIIFTPLGLELFPFWRPSQNMQAVFWNEIQRLGVTEDGKMMEIDLAGENERKIYVALAPLRRESRELLRVTVAAAERSRRTEGAGP